MTSRADKRYSDPEANRGMDEEVACGGTRDQKRAASTEIENQLEHCDPDEAAGDAAVT
jgi:hypothetical protein